MTLTNMGAAYSALGDKAQALAYYAEGAGNSTADRGQSRRGSDTTNIGIVYSHLGTWYKH
ncbi:MAG: hypothetical protein IPK16_27070 [Anaerolineales bacterium]|nr:hypothetical protein [Anaerolineales bacterium]